MLLFQGVWIQINCVDKTKKCRFVRRKNTQEHLTRYSEKQCERLGRQTRRFERSVPSKTLFLGYCFEKRLLV